jgi:hypothetical protein
MAKPFERVSMSNGFQIPLFRIVSRTTGYEEHVKIFYPGNIFESPVLRVTDEHRERWPAEYAAFRQSLSLLNRFRLWRDAPKKADITNSPEFDNFLNEGLVSRMKNREIDQNIRADIDAAINK